MPLNNQWGIGLRSFLDWWDLKKSSPEGEAGGSRGDKAPGLFSSRRPISQASRDNRDWLITGKFYYNNKKERAHKNILDFNVRTDTKTISVGSQLEFPFGGLGDK